MRKIILTIEIEYHGFDESEAPKAAELLAADVPDFAAQLGADGSRVKGVKVVDQDAV